MHSHNQCILILTTAQQALRSLRLLVSLGQLGQTLLVALKTVSSVRLVAPWLLISPMVTTKSFCLAVSNQVLSTSCSTLMFRMENAVTSMCCTTLQAAAPHGQLNSISVQLMMAAALQHQLKAMVQFTLVATAPLMYLVFGISGCSTEYTLTWTRTSQHCSSM